MTYTTIKLSREQLDALPVGFRVRETVGDAQENESYDYEKVEAGWVRLTSNDYTDESLAEWRPLFDLFGIDPDAPNDGGMWDNNPHLISLVPLVANEEEDVT